MPDPNGALQAVLLAPLLRDSGLDWEIVDTTGSTNADLIARARRQAPSLPILLAADRQTAGRGRLGRVWHAAPGGALLFSLAVPWDVDPGASAAVSLACGVAIARCLEAAGVAVQLKWPNDVLLDGRKLAGMLTEMTEDAQGARTLVVGVGLNLRVDARQRIDIGHPVAELAERVGAAAAREREAWLARLVLALLGALRDYPRHGFAAYQADYERVCAYKGAAVELSQQGQATRRGILQGVDAQGRLRLACEDGHNLTIMSGELSLRPAAAAGTSPGDPS